MKVSERKEEIYNYEWRYKFDCDNESQKKIVLFPITFIVVCLSVHSSKQLNIVKERTGFFHFRGLLMPMCRSPPFFA